jgi:hypothetical protein
VEQDYRVMDVSVGPGRKRHEKDGDEESRRKREMAGSRTRQTWRKRPYIHRKKDKQTGILLSGIGSGIVDSDLS